MYTKILEGIFELIFLWTIHQTGFTSQSLSVSWAWTQYLSFAAI